MGPTATGKTDIALKLAKKFQGEIISGDSRQVYKRLDIGTGKLPTKSNQVKIRKGNGFWEINGIKIWAYDLIDPRKQYSVANYIQDAQKYLIDLISRNKLPIIVGGTYFYIKALVDGLENLSQPLDLNLRKKLASFSLGELQQELKKLSPQKWQELNESDQQNSRRLVRAIELLQMNLYRDKKKRWRGLKKTKDILKIGLIAPREILYQNADRRVLIRINQGMIKEAEKLHQKGLTFKRMKALGLEYAVLADYLQGKIKTLEGPVGFINILQSKIHGFIRKQLTWLKKDPQIKWFDMTESNFEEKIEKMLAKWYYSEIK